jgi:hypothetical protein
MMNQFVKLALFCLLVFPFGKSICQTTPTIPLDAEAQSWPASISEGEKLGRSTPLREMQPEVKPENVFAEGEKIEKQNYFGHNTLIPGAPHQGKPDPVIQGAQPEFAPQIKPKLNIEGLRNTGSTPPDPTGDVGKNHYIQMTNAGGGSRLKIWDKQGVALFDGPSSSIWSQINTGSIGDPLIQYDHSIDRWFMMEMQGGNELLVAVTETPDPMGAWDMYRFQTEGFPDYPKLYIWPNALFVTVNEITDPGGNQCSGYALEKSALVQGAASFKVYRYQFPKYQGLAYQPATGADWEAGPPPPPGSPGYIFRMLDNNWTGQGQDKIDIWEVNVNWTNINQSTSTGPKSIFPAPFESKVCYGWFDCIDQPGTNQRITALDQIIMYRVPYRNYGDYEAVVFSHVSDLTNNDGPGGKAGVRWYELRKYPSQEWTIYQQGTFAPDQTNRFMSMLTMDGSGNIGLGYSIADENMYPSIGLTGRTANDPLGIMSVQEFIAAPGQTSHDTPRWGDYCNMAVDPVDDRTFWFTAEYQPSNADWGTKVIAFQLQKDTFDISPFSQVAPIASPNLTNSETVQVQINNYGLSPTLATSVQLFFEGNLIATEALSQVIQPDGSYTHTFTPKVDASIVGKTYKFIFVTTMTQDGFPLNDTLRTEVRKLTTNDAAIKVQVKGNSEMCSSVYNMPVAIYNAAAQPLTSVQLNYRLNTGTWKSIIWNGNIEPLTSDTISITLNGVVNGQNLMFLATSLPNGQPDQDIKNDTFFYKFSGFAGTSYHTIDFKSIIGNLKWEIRNATNILVRTGTTADPFYPDLCLPIGCYSLKLVPLSNSIWTGNWALNDANGNAIYYTEEVLQMLNIDFCVTALQSNDIGPWNAIQPQSKFGLTNTEFLEVGIRNYGSEPATGVQVSVEFENASPITETIPITLEPGVLYQHRFQPNYDLSIVDKTYTWKIKTIWPTDAWADNDILTHQVRHLPQLDVEVKNLSAEAYCKQNDNGYFLVTLHNQGQETLEDVIIELNLNGSILLDTFDIRLETGEEETYTLFHDNDALFGTNDVTATVLIINQMSTDFNPFNQSKSANFTPSTLNDELTVLFDANAYGGASRMSWKLVNDVSGQVVASGGPYPAWSTTGQMSFCLASADCYTFKIYYPGTTGWPGTFDLISASNANNVFSYSSTPFTDSLVYTFCGLDACAQLSLTVDVTNASNTVAANGSATLHGQGGNPPYFYSLDGNNFLLDSVFQGLVAGNYLGRVADLDACMRETPFTIGSSVATTEPKTDNISIKPNPIKDLVYITMPKEALIEGKAVCIVRDIHGRIIIQDELAPWDDQLRGVFSLKQVNDGVYFLSIYRNGKVTTKRLVKVSQ